MTGESGELIKSLQRHSLSFQPYYLYHNFPFLCSQLFVCTASICLANPNYHVIRLTSPVTPDALLPFISSPQIFDIELRFSLLLHSDHEENAVLIAIPKWSIGMNADKNGACVRTNQSDTEACNGDC
jgi:hypothetical protein